MEPLWNPDRHEALGNIAWDEATARFFIQRIVNAATLEYIKSGGWPIDPRDHEDDGPAGQANGLYFGSAGNIWTLQRLKQTLEVSVSIDLRSAAFRAYEASQIKPDSEDPGLLISRGGSELLAYALGFDEAAEALTRSIEACGGLEQPKELFWGPPAALLLAYHAYQVEQDPVWLTLFLKYGRNFLENFGLEKDEVWQWPQQLYGELRPCTVGAAHGFVGAMLPFMLAYDHLPEDMQNGIFDKLLSCIQDIAVENDAYANWPPGIRPGFKGELLLQWCHGAPGIVSALSHLPQSYLKTIRSLLEKGGEAIWAAGPLKKPAGLCHGTAGNAYAFIRLHSMTGEKKWLDRARSFAMHAMEQSKAEQQKKAAWHYSLLTGDMGLAVFLADCILGSSGHLPVIESFSFHT